VGVELVFKLTNIGVDLRFNDTDLMAKLLRPCVPGGYALLEQCDALVVRHRMIRGREAVRGATIAAAACPRPTSPWKNWVGRMTLERESDSCAEAAGGIDARFGPTHG